jgi:phospholipid transport system substrate-binding protein
LRPATGTALDKGALVTTALVRSFRTLVVAACLIAVTVPIRAAETAEHDAVALIRTLGDQAIEVLGAKDVSLAQREDRFRELFRDSFAIERIGRFALGRYWRNASEEQRAEYLNLFSEWVVKKYARLFGGYSGEKFEVVGSRSNPKDANDVIVSTVVIQNGQPLFDADWRVQRLDDRPLIIDIFFEGVSMLVTQRDDFIAVARRNGVDTLLTTLRDRIAKLEEQSG